MRRFTEGVGIFSTLARGLLARGRPRRAQPVGVVLLVAALLAASPSGAPRGWAQSDPATPEPGITDLRKDLAEIKRELAEIRRLLDRQPQTAPRPLERTASIGIAGRPSLGRTDA